MSLVLANNNGADTAVSGLTTNPLALRILNLSADWFLVEEGPGRVTYKNQRGPMSNEDTIVLAANEVKDIYKGINLVEVFKSRHRKALQVMYQYNGMIPETDSTDATVLNYVPWTGRIVFKFPLHPQFTSAMALNKVQTVCALPWAKGLAATDADPIIEIMRGSRKL